MSNHSEKKIAVIGYGYVGKAVVDFFKGHYHGCIYDPHSKEVRSVSKEEVNKCDMAVVCVPTPVGEQGQCDTTIVENTLGWLETPLIVIKSTVYPGFTDWALEAYGKRIVFSPEYIGEGKYQVQWWKDRGYPHPTDMKKHDFFIFGGERGATHEAIQYWLKVTGPDPKYIQTDPTTAEATKYMENTWGATKVRFCNEWADIAEVLGIDYAELRELFLLDGRTERMHTAVFDDQRGFGGKCFPKDLSAIIRRCEDESYEPTLLKSVRDGNKGEK